MAGCPAQPSACVQRNEGTTSGHAQEDSLEAGCVLEKPGTWPAARLLYSDDFPGACLGQVDLWSGKGKPLVTQKWNGIDCLPISLNGVVRAEILTQLPLLGVAGELGHTWGGWPHLLFPPGFPFSRTRCLLQEQRLHLHKNTHRRVLGSNWPPALQAFEHMEQFTPILWVSAGHPPLRGGIPSFLAE